MIKVIWLLKRADHLSLEEFRVWWLERHALMFAEAQKAYVKKYTLNIRRPRDGLPGEPPDECDWDGCAELWFESEADFGAVYGRLTLAPLRADTLAHVSRFERLIVDEHEIGLG